jgi:hypothetical protein
MNDNDILILLKKEILSLTSKPNILLCNETDAKFSLLPGTTKRFIRVAADAADHDIISEGDNLIELQRRPDRLVRG